MTRISRRGLLAGLAAVAGCAGRRPPDATARGSTPTTDGTAASTRTTQHTGTTATARPTAGAVPFDDLDPAAAPRRCLDTDYVTTGTTPRPTPTPAAPTAPAAAVAVAVGYERAVTYDWVVRQFDPVDRETATPPAAVAPRYPAVRTRYRARRLLGRVDAGAVVHLRYDRRVEPPAATPRSRPVTANYFLTPSVAVRAATDGHVTPGPHPTAAGERLACE